MRLPSWRRIAYLTYRGLGRPLGFNVYNDDVAWPWNQDYRDAWQKFQGPKSHYVHERRFSLYSLATAVGGLPGATAECGCLYGEGSHLILAASGGESTHHIFDSFEGLSEPSQGRDEPRQSWVRPWVQGDLAVDAQVVQKNLHAFADRVVLHPGWIPDRFPEVKHEQFRLIHIDVDLYQPTLDSYEFFRPRVVTGGMIICDDYGSLTCPGARSAFDEAACKFGDKVIELTTGQGVVFVRD